MKIVTLIIATLFISMNSVFAQGELKIKNAELKLVDLKANDQVQTEVFKIKNTGNQPILITRVTPMSSMLKANWSRAPLAPGQTGEISVTFASVNMPENFNYKIMIYSNAKNNRAEAVISGNLVDNPDNPGLLYKFNMNGLKFKTSHIGFNDVYNWQIIYDTVYFINTKKEAVTLGVQYKPAYVSATFVPEKIQSGEKGAIIITYDAPKKNDYGYNYSSLHLKFNDEKSYNNRLSITASIVEDFSKLSKKDLDDAPIAFFDKKEISFGDITKGAKANCDFVLTNTGKSTLFVRKTAASCGCTAVTMGEKALAAGKSTTIRVVFDSSGKSGRQYKSVTVITNDPKNPEVRLTINGNIK